MKTNLRNLVCAVALLFCGAAIVAQAQVGTPPAAQSGPASQDGTWLLGLSHGQNRNYVSGITAHAGGTQAAAYQLPAGVALIQVDTTATSGDSVNMPFAIQGTVVMVANAGSGTLYIYGNANTNRATATTDTINAVAGSTAYQVATATSVLFFCAKNGAWVAIKSA